MRFLALAVASLALVTGMLVPTVSAQTSQPITPQPLPPAPLTPSVYLGPPVQHPTGGQFPWVVNLKPYTPETNNMSLPGYLRQVVFQQTGKWITPAEARRVIEQQRTQ